MADSVELAKIYDPTQVESEIYALWEREDCFRATPDERPPERRFVIMIPLPNVTGALHLGHAINNSLQDIQIRYHRMLGDNTLWQPGTDHAGIATQAVVERRIFETEGKSRHDLGREELVRRIWAWKDQYEARILGQLKQMGCSCDWQRTRFTLDEVCAKAVRHTFFKMFKDGLIYRGKRLVNWDTQLQTAVADDEVYHETIQATLTHIRYPVAGTDQHLTVATTRVETMLGDTAVAVHPDDPRYKHLIGQTCLLPLMNREIPIIGDPVLVNPEFGTGCVKVTPAHDPNDYDCGQRNGLEMINILTPDGSINDNGGPYAGLDRYGARKKVTADLEAQGLIERIEDYEHDVGHSDRSKTPIEPYLSDQWFVKMGEIEGGVALADGTRPPGLAQAAMHAVTSGRVRMFPERYTKTYLDWLGEKRDWCISRQLWWGHRIPIWTREMRASQLTLADTQDDALAGLLEIAWGYAVISVEEISGSRRWHDLRYVRIDGDAGGGIDWSAFAGAVEEGDFDIRVMICVDTDLPLSNIEAKRLIERARAAGIHITESDLESDPSLGSRRVIAYAERAGFKQDTDVLDTWFSSQLWPHSTLGWPDEGNSRKYNLDYYYPGSVLITSRDIITLWVARMVLSGLYNVGDIPFHHVYVHTKLLDGRGETMSKSKGNGVDPLDIIRLYGADALRYTMADLATDTQDVRMPVDYRCPHCRHLTPQTKVVPRDKRPGDITKVKCGSCGKHFATQWAEQPLKDELGVALETSDKFELGRNFCNKLWNAARFAFMNLSEPPFRLPVRSPSAVRADLEPRGTTPYEKLDLANLPPEDRWILATLSATIRRTNQQLQAYQFSQCIKDLREFFWDNLCDWYIELTKARLTGDTGAEAAAPASTPPEPRASARAESNQPNASGSPAATARQILAFVLDQNLRLFHPFIPFITERLWGQLNAIAPQRGLPGVAEPAMSDLLITAQYPPQEGWPALDDAEIREVFADLQAATRGVRDLRAKCNVPPRDRVTVTLNAPAEHV
ncbi:MAG: valine--tRNA ligase, partial [Planctomycetota bacterium]